MAKKEEKNLKVDGKEKLQSTKNTTKKTKEKKNKKESYIKEVKHEMKKVTFPSSKEVMKYTFATIVFCTVLVLFFILLNLLLSVVKGMF